MRIRMILILCVLFFLFLFGAVFFSYVFAFMGKLSYIDAQNVKNIEGLINGVLKKDELNLKTENLYRELKEIFFKNLYIKKNDEEKGNLTLKSFLKPYISKKNNTSGYTKRFLMKKNKIYFIYYDDKNSLTIIGEVPYVLYKMSGYLSFLKGLFVIYILLIFGISFVIYLVVTKRVVVPINRITDLIYDYSYKREFSSFSLNDRKKTIEDILRIMKSYFGNVENKIRKAYEENKKNQLKLITAQRLAATGKLASGIAHEINNPISGMINALRMIKNKKRVDNEVFEYIELIEDGLNRISSIVKKILQFNNMNVNTKEDIIFLEKSIWNALEFVKHEIKTKNISIEIINNTKNDVKIKGNEVEFQQIIMNLIINAIDAIEENGDIKIEIKEENKKVYVSIKDNGCGIDEKSLHQIFDMFYTTKEDKGTGLGLYIVYNLVKNFSGDIEILSEKNKGTEVILEFLKFEEAE